MISDQIRRPDPAGQETSFERPRGVSHIEVRHGYSQVHISGLRHPVMHSRLGVLRAVADEGVSIDFLKLTPSGMSFLVPESAGPSIEAPLSQAGAEFSVREGRSIVLVHAVNIRDEEGMIANIVQGVIATGASVDHVGDMHDRMLLVVKTEDSERVVSHLANQLIGGGA